MSQLAAFIQQQRHTKSILLMTHVIYGYPDIASSLQMMHTILQKGVAILEVQFPFSDPVADGPTITDACHQALENQPKLGQCITDISQLAAQFPNSKVLLMSYLNPLLQYGFDALAADLAANISGVIIPDLPIDQHNMVAPLVAANVDPIWLMIPDMEQSRIDFVAAKARGMLYCVSRKGVTGQGADSQRAKQQLHDYLDAIKASTTVPLALGFGISTAEQVSELIGVVDIAVVGSALLRAFQTQGLVGFSEKIDQLMSVS